MKSPFPGLAAVVLTALLTTNTPGQVQLVQSGPADDSKPPTIPTIKLTLSPAPEPKPALRYQLLPELRDRTSGNAVLHYYRAFSPEWQTMERHETVRKALDAWSEDTQKMPAADLRFLVNFAALKELDLGARRTYAEWNMLDRLRKDGLALLLPDVQGFRQCARLLAVRARFQIHDKKWSEAEYTLQTALQFAHDVGDAPTLIQSLVGMAQTNIALAEIEQWLQQPGSPNLYWALTDLPAPFVDLRKPIQGERLFFDNLFPGMREMARDLKPEPLSPAELDRLIVRFAHARQLAGMAPQEAPWTTRLGLAVVAASAYPEGKRFLREQGIPAEQVEKLPVTQVFLMYEANSYELYYDSMAKWFGQPYPIALAGLQRASKEFQAARQKAGPTGMTLAGLLLPAVEHVHEASYRVERKIAGLRCLEALRLYAAEHDGELPERLADIKAVPVPSDPLTGRPFEYRREAAGRALLIAPAPSGMSEEVAYGRHPAWKYEITLRR